MGTDERTPPKARPTDLGSTRSAARRPGRGLSIAALLGTLAVGALACAAQSPTASGATSSTASTAPAPPAGPAASTVGGVTPCPPADGSAARTTRFAQAPTLCIDTAKTYTATMKTTKGDITLALDAQHAPTAVNNFVTLSRYHFYDGTAFHRVIPGFMAQGGDATGNPPGTGNPGYRFADELPADASAYVPGVLAMANSGPDTNGSQFFIVLAPGKLSADYSIFGQVTAGFDTTLKTIEKGGSASGTPTDPATITSVTISES